MSDVKTGGMVELVSTCKKCKGQPDTREFELPDYKGECCNDDDCMLVVRWEEKRQKIQVENLEDTEE